jgi:biofilm PGA synthesis N-glycosyltransferase PgaC
MRMLELTFWLATACVAYAYVGYPLLLLVLASWRTRPVRRDGPTPRSFSVVVAAHNEEAMIEARLRELTDLVTASGLPAEILVVCDGCTDNTAALAKRCTSGPVRVLELPHNVGKAAALTQGCQAAVHEILVLADCRQAWAPDALPHLLENFADPGIGAVSGDLVVENRRGLMDGVSLYWRYEKWVRRHEGRVHSTVGVTGAIAAVRRPLFRPIPPGTVLDDVYWPLQVVMQGYRVVHDSRAQAFDRLPERAPDEFRRKVRTLSGNFQLLSRLPGALLPWRNPVWLLYVSHKLLRLAVPWALLVMTASCLLLPQWPYRLALGVQAAVYALALAGLVPGVGIRSRLTAWAGSFLVLNAAAWLAFWVWICGKTSQSWRQVRYSPALGFKDPAGRPASGRPETSLALPASFGNSS